MKHATKILTALSLSLLSLGFTDDLGDDEDFAPPQPPYAELNPIEKSSKVYTSLGIAALPSINGYLAGPSITFGQRTTYGNHGVDYSCNFAGVEKTDAKESYQADLAKAVYLYYLQPEENTRIYLGGGGSFGGYYRTGHHYSEKTEHDKRHISHFVGLNGSGTLGCSYESTALTSFVELNCSLPLLAVYKDKAPTFYPAYTLSVGLGF